MSPMMVNAATRCFTNLVPDGMDSTLYAFSATLELEKSATVLPAYLCLVGTSVNEPNFLILKDLAGAPLEIKQSAAKQPYKIRLESHTCRFDYVSLAPAVLSNSMISLFRRL